MGSFGEAIFKRGYDIGYKQGYDIGYKIGFSKEFTRVCKSYNIEKEIIVDGLMKELKCSKLEALNYYEIY